jgi:hypothetical protein
MTLENGFYIDELKRPARLWGRAQILTRPCPVPRVPGVYGWYFRDVPPGVPIDDCLHVQGASLLYVGISPKQSPRNGGPPSRQQLANRVRYHFRGNAAGSTLRFTLGCLLAEILRIELRRVGSGDRQTFATGEYRLSDWMADNAFVCWIPTENPWIVEDMLISKLSLPLNLQGNEGHPFHRVLRALRSLHRSRATQLPIIK